MQLIGLSNQKRWIGLATFLFSAWPLVAFGQTSLVDSSLLVGARATGLHRFGAVNSIIVQSNGSIMLGGDFDHISGSSHPNLARINADGSYDSSFDGRADGEVYRLLLQKDGKILVAGGFTNLQGVVRHRIGRLLANGQVDPEFDPGSLLASNHPAMALALQFDSKVLVATLPIGSDPVSARLFRLHPNGALDESFVQTNLFLDWHIYAIHVRTNGTILVGGGFNSAGGHSLPALVRLQSDGHVDTNFNAQLQNLSSVFTIHEQTNGNLLIGGLIKRVGTTNDISLARLTANLDWDDSFSTDQFLTYLEGFPVVRAILEQPDGKLVVTGDFLTVGGYWRRNIARLDTQGRVDSCFDPGLGLTGYYPGGSSLARQSDGRILVGGYFDSVDGRPIANIARLLPESDCDAIRVHFGRTSSYGGFYVAQTSPPGGMGIMEASTNLVDWIEMYQIFLPSMASYGDPSGSFAIIYVDQTARSRAFFRVRKAY